MVERHAGIEELKKRMRQFGIRVIRLVNSLPRSLAADVIARQLIFSATSVGSNYRAACRARSPAEFMAKMGVVEEECDESLHWITVLIECEMIDASRTRGLISEREELLAITVASIRTARAAPRRSGKPDRDSGDSAFRIPHSAFAVEHSATPPARSR